MYTELFEDYIDYIHSHDNFSKKNVAENDQLSRRTKEGF